MLWVANELARRLSISYGMCSYKSLFWARTAVEYSFDSCKNTIAKQIVKYLRNRRILKEMYSLYVTPTFAIFLGIV